jgi:GNAT superfamily N-acetyltransferase
VTTEPVIAKLIDLTADPRTRARQELEAIFWETAPKAPAEPTARAAFHQRWLGQYLLHEPDLCWVAQSSDGQTLGYLVGSFVDPATSPRFADLPYVQAFADATRTHPAHLHINLTERARGQGIGVRLIEKFIAACRARQVSGLHVVTGARQRNMRFYLRCGFRELARYQRDPTAAVCLARRTD